MFLTFASITKLLDVERRRMDTFTLRGTFDCFRIELTPVLLDLIYIPCFILIISYIHEQMHTKYVRYICMCLHLLVNITDLLGLLKKCRCNEQLCALDERIACRILLEKYFEISVWIQDGLNVLRTLLNGTFFH